MTIKEIGQMLKTAREERGLTQEEVSQKIGVAHATVSRWETGKRSPSLVQVIDLVNLYKVKNPGKIFK